MVEFLDEESEWLNAKAEHHLPDYPFKTAWRNGFLRATNHYLEEIKKLQDIILELQRENIALKQGRLKEAEEKDSQC